MPDAISVADSRASATKTTLPEKNPTPPFNIASKKEIELDMIAVFCPFFKISDFSILTDLFFEK